MSVQPEPGSFVLHSPCFGFFGEGNVRHHWEALVDINSWAFWELRAENGLELIAETNAVFNPWNSEILVQTFGHTNCACVWTNACQLFSPSSTVKCHSESYLSFNVAILNFMCMERPINFVFSLWRVVTPIPRMLRPRLCGGKHVTEREGKNSANLKVFISSRYITCFLSHLGQGTCIWRYYNTKTWLSVFSFAQKNTFFYFPVCPGNNSELEHLFLVLFAVP